jgi:putative heme transporter
LRKASGSAIDEVATVPGPSVLNIFAKLFLRAVAFALIILTARASGSLVGVRDRGRRPHGFGGAVRARHVEEAVRARDRERAGTFAEDLRVGGRCGPLPPTINHIVARWLALSSSTIISHLMLYLVMLLALRFVGVSNDEVSWAQVLGVFASDDC